MAMHSANTSRSGKPDEYVGVHRDINGGMTEIGRMVRDAQVFDLIAETETCEGWNLSRIDQLLQRVNDEWDKYGCLASQLPAELYQRYRKSHDEAAARARDAGWCPDLDIENDQ